MALRTVTPTKKTILKLQRAVLLGCTLLFACSLAQAKYRFDSWTSENGLPQNSVNAILQTRDGYLWLGTSDGLARFDGLRFTTFNRGNTKGIASNRFTVLFEDRAGDLWAGTEDGGLTRYHDGTFKTFTTADGLVDERVVALQEDSDGNLLALSNGGIVRREGEQFVSVSATYPEGMRFRLKAEQLEELWYVDGSGLHRFAHNRLTTYTTQDGLSNLDVLSTYEDQHGAVWVATAGPALHRFQNGKTRVFTKADGLPEANVTAFVCEDRQGNLWLRAPGEGLGLLKDGQFTNFTTDLGFPVDRVNTAFEDREGNVWIGTSKNGLFRVREDLITTFTKENGLGSNIVYPILQTRDGSVWIGTAGAGITRYKDGVFQTFTKKDGLGNNNVFSLYEDTQGRLWIGTNSGLSVYEDGKFRLFYSDESLLLAQVQAITLDRAGDLWFGASNGLRRYRDGKVTRYTPNDLGVAGDDVRALFEDRNGVLWIATYGGLSLCKDGKFTSYTESNGLSSNHVRSLYEDTDGTMWIGTYDGGLNRFTDGKFISYTMEAGLSDNGAFVVLDDNRGSLWMSSNRGIHRVSKQQLLDYVPGRNMFLNGILYGKSDGMLNIECNGGRQPAGIKTSDNRLWFPTMGGVAVVDLSLVRPNQQPPPVVIESVLLDHRRLDPRNTIEIAPGETNLEIHYTGLSFIRSEQIRFKYQLTSLDRDWVDVGTTRVAVFSHLPPGTYTFNVIAANSDGVWNNTGQTLRVVVRPPFWRTWWFLTLAVLSFIGIAYSLNHRRIRSLKAAQAAQEAFSRQLIDSQESERKRIAAELHDGLGQNLLIIKNRALLGLSSPDDLAELREQFDQISTISSQTLNEVREISYNLRPYQIDQLGLTKAIAVMLKKVAQSAGLQLTSELDKLDDLFDAKEEINFYRVVQEAFNNVVKHSGATETLVTIKREPRKLVLTVKDNGRGFASEAVALAESRQGGFGLVGISERARMLGGKLIIKSVPSEGTTITLIIEIV